MAKIDASQLVLERKNGVWSVKLRDGRAWRTPINVASERPVWGTRSGDGDFRGAFGAAQRFSARVGVLNAWGYSGMDGRVQALVDEVDVLKAFEFEWPQLMKTDGDENAIVLSSAGSVGDFEVQIRASGVARRKAPGVGRLVVFTDASGDAVAKGKLHRVVAAPSGEQSAGFSIGLHPALTDAVPSGSHVKWEGVTGKVRFSSRPGLTTNNGVVFETVFNVRESLE